MTSSRDASQVSCKLCLRSVEKETDEPVRKTPTLAELRAAAKAAAAPKISVEAAKSTLRLSPSAEWQKRLEQLPGRNRLPRGVSRQAFI
nr:hypothetical protein [Stutzerimonas stutzeri]